MKHLLLLPTLLVFSLLVAACLDDGDRVAAPAPIATRAPEPTPEVYVAQRGDYLALIADKFDVPLSQLLELNDILDPSIIEIGQEIVIREAAPLPDVPPPAVTTDAPASEIPPEEDARWPFTVTSDQARLAALGTTALAATFALFFILRAAILVIAGYGSRAGRDIAQRRTASGQSGMDTSLIAADRKPLPRLATPRVLSLAAAERRGPEARSRRASRPARGDRAACRPPAWPAPAFLDPRTRGYRRCACDDRSQLRQVAALREAAGSRGARERSRAGSPAPPCGISRASRDASCDGIADRPGRRGGAALPHGAPAMRRERVGPRGRDLSTGTRATRGAARRSGRGRALSRPRRRALQA